MPRRRIARPLGLALLGATLAATPRGAEADLAEVKTRGALRVIIAADESADTFALGPGPRPGFEREIMERFTGLQGLRLSSKAGVRGDGHLERNARTRLDVSIEQITRPERQPEERRPAAYRGLSRAGPDRRTPPVFRSLLA